MIKLVHERPVWAYFEYTEEDVSDVWGEFKRDQYVKMHVCANGYSEDMTTLSTYEDKQADINYIRMVPGPRIRPGDVKVLKIPCMKLTTGNREFMCAHWGQECTRIMQWHMASWVLLKMSRDRHLGVIRQEGDTQVISHIYNNPFVLGPPILRIRDNTIVSAKVFDDSEWNRDINSDWYNPDGTWVREAEYLLREKPLEYEFLFHSKGF